MLGWKRHKHGKIMDDVPVETGKIIDDVDVSAISLSNMPSAPTSSVSIEQSGAPNPVVSIVNLSAAVNANSALQIRAARTNKASIVIRNAANDANLLDVIESVGLNFADAKNIRVGTTTGTKIGTVATEKLGFFGATPVVQQAYTAVSDPPTAAQVTAIRDALVNLGLMASA